MVGPLVSAALNRCQNGGYGKGNAEDDQDPVKIRPSAIIAITVFFIQPTVSPSSYTSHTKPPAGRMKDQPAAFFRFLLPSDPCQRSQFPKGMLPGQQVPGFLTG